MSVTTIPRVITNERGVALPMALITLVLLTTLMLAFAVLAQTEPIIAANQLRGGQARSLAESGFELGLWALTNSTDAQGLAAPLPSPMPATLSGTFVAVGGTGGFTVTVTNGPDADSRTITSTGWTPTNSVTDTRTKAHRRVSAIVSSVPNIAFTAPCALCVKGALNITGNSAINGSNSDTHCGANNRYGTYTKDTTTTGGSASVSGGTDPNTGAALSVAQGRPASDFDAFTFSNSALDQLKTLAKKNRTYFGPQSTPDAPYGTSGATDNDGKACPVTQAPSTCVGPGGPGTCPNVNPPAGCGTASAYNPSVTFNSSNKVANGVVFVDTTDGNNIDPAGTGTSTLPNLDIHGNPFSDASGTFNGYLVVNGSLQISGNMQIQGLVYALNDFTYNGTGGGGISGLAISQNIRDTSATSIDTSTSGNSTITFNCANASALNFVNHGFQLRQGTYRELAGE